MERLPAVVLAAVVALAGPCAEAVAADGFDVRVALHASWPPVPPRAAALEWAKRLGTQAASETLLGAGPAPAGLGGAFGSLLVANRFFSPAVEAQRAACRALAARLVEGSAPSAPCGGGPFAAVRTGSEWSSGLRVACDAEGLEEAVRSPAKEGTVAELGRLSVDLPLRDESLGERNGTEVVLCGCVEDEALRSLVRWALQPSPARAQPLAVVYRQADCGGAGARPGELLSGYAVELRIKSGEYKATDDAAVPRTPAVDDASVPVDDDDAEEDSAVDVLEGVEVAGLRLGVLARRFPSLGRELVALREQLEAESGGSELARWELEDLGLRAAQRTTRSPEPLRTLASVTESFPATMAALARQMTVKPRWRRALKKLRLAEVPEKQESMELNGQPLALAELSLFPLLHRLEPQFAAIARLGEDAEEALARLQVEGTAGPAAQPTRLDWRDAALKWCYHVRHDEEAEDWPVRLSSLASASTGRGAESDFLDLAASRSGPKPLQLQQPIFSLIFVFDPLQTSALEVAVELVRPSRPARVALLLVPSDPATPGAGLARAVADAFGWLLRTGGKSDAMAARAFLQALAAKPPASVVDVEVSMQKQLPKAGRGAASAWAKVEAAAASSAFEAYARAKGLAAPSLLLNGRVLQGEPRSLLPALAAAQSEEQATLTAAVSAKRLRDAKKPKDSEAQLESFLLSAAVAATYDAALTPGLRVAAARARDSTELLPQAGLLPQTGLLPAVEASTDPVAPVLLPADLLVQLPSFVGGSAGAEASVSLLLFLRRPEHLPLLGHFSAFLSTPNATGLRLAVVVAPAEPCSPSCLRAGASPGEALHEAALCCEAEACKCAASESTEAAERLWRELPAAVRARPGAVAVCNGQVVPDVPVSPGAPLLLVAHWCPAPLAGLAPEAAAVAAAALQRRQPSKAFRRCAEDAPKALRVHLAPRNPHAPVLAEVAATVDPLGESTAALAHLAQLLHSELNAQVCMVLNPRESFEDYPLKKWQRHVFASSLTEVEPWPAAFARLRTQHTLTLAMVCPPSWLVTAQASEHDLDNVRAADAVAVVGARPDITATFVLSRLYLEGSAYVEGSGNAATGLQLELLPAAGLGESAGGCGVADTRVMQNRGFWSMPACPGAFEPALVPGASNETFVLDAREPVEVTSFVLPQLPLKVSVRPGRKEEDLARKTLGARARRRARRAQLASPKAAGSCPTIHVFSLASGHLYERLLAIMMFSVRNHSACPLHFWLVSNFLSPRFTDLLPRLMADMEDVAYDLVSFKWPSWLNPQKEKQRLIWAYKILFLDVLFPMDVPRVIFVDSDLVVRADLRELWDMDLQGRAYGFTPFCSGEVELSGARVQRKNNATTGFRFWDSGYWKGHLGKLPYHISALFVVDLLEFRRQSVGDQLRSTYNALTQDPSSLANLDQDLPNYAQHTVPIFSLPQEWLWCETWCSVDTKPLAKAIDLCQNPSTKEPKTAMAQRVIGEWDAYHARVLALQGTGPTTSSRSAARDEL